MRFAVTRAISDAFQDCQLTCLPRTPIDLDRARAQHDAYEWALVELGCTVRRVDSGADMPDAVFVEDIAVVFAEGAILTRPGAESRRIETPAVADALARFGLPLREIQEPGTLDGGDVLVVGRDVFIGASTRTNAQGIDQMRRILTRLGYRVRAVPVQGCLHLKSAAAAVAPGTLLINRNWVPADAFTELVLIDVDADEPLAANALLVGDTVIYPAAFPRTRDRLEQHGVRVRTVDVDELAKAEGGVACCSLVFGQ
jgi:dimethylargininase